MVSVEYVVHHKNTRDESYYFYLMLYILFGDEEKH